MPGWLVTKEQFKILNCFVLFRKMRTLLISERRAAVNVNFAVTKLLALEPAHGGDKHRLEGISLILNCQLVKLPLPTIRKQD